MVINMIDIVLVEPEIPSNTGNISRTCAVTGARLHLIEPLGFDISEKSVRRAGLDYWDKLELFVYASIDEFFKKNHDRRFFLASTKAPASYHEADLSGDVMLIFGKETAGLPEELLSANLNHCIRIPMRDDTRSLNLSNSVAIICYEALRQQGFPGLTEAGKLKL